MEKQEQPAAKRGGASQESCARLRICAAALSFAMLAACSEPPAGIPPTSALRADKIALAQRTSLSELEAAVKGRKDRGVEDDILRLEAAAPGIGGVYIDASGRVNVYMRDKTNRGIAIAALRALGLKMNGALPEAARFAAGDVVVQTGEFSFSELLGWSQVLLADAVNVPGFVSIDADESSNRVVVTLSDTTQRGEITRLAASAGVPPTAVEVRSGYAAVPLLNLRSTIRPLAGGFEFQNGGGGRCTIGYNVTTPQGETGFLTAAHCSLGSSGGGSTGETMYQITSAVGTVALNPMWTNGCYTTVGNGGYFAGPCSEADVLFVSTSSSDALKRLALTFDVEVNNAPGSIGVAGYYNAFSAPLFAWVGVEAEKTGRTTGATRGIVQGTCESLVVTGSPSYIITCADRVTSAGAGRGDSGAPVYRHIDTGIYPLGTLFAGSPLNAFDAQGTAYCSSNCTYFYSPWQNIQNRLARTFDPQPQP